MLNIFIERELHMQIKGLYPILWEYTGMNTASQT